MLSDDALDDSGLVRPKDVDALFALELVDYCERREERREKYRGAGQLPAREVTKGDSTARGGASSGGKEGRERWNERGRRSLESRTPLAGNIVSMS